MKKTREEVEKSIIVDGVKYVPEGSVTKMQASVSLKGKPYKIVRTYSAGVFVGYITKRNGKEVTLINARRLWYWDGANSLSELAVSGVSKPENCKFSVPVVETELTEVIEVLFVSKKAQESIAGVKEWKQNE